MTALGKIRIILGLVWWTLFGVRVVTDASEGRQLFAFCGAMASMAVTVLLWGRDE